MIEIHSTRVYGLADAIRNSRISYQPTVPIFDSIEIDKDYERVSTLLGSKPPGTGEDKFLRFITVQMVVKASKYWWCEFDTYHHKERQSQGTLHCAKKFNYDTVRDPSIDPIIWSRFMEIVKEYIDHPSTKSRMRFRANLPEGFALTSAVTTNYATLKTIISKRVNHPLPEWRVFCDWIRRLPYVSQLGVVDSSPVGPDVYTEYANFYDLGDLLFRLISDKLTDDSIDDISSTDDDNSDNVGDVNSPDNASPDDTPTQNPVEEPVESTSVEEPDASSVSESLDSPDSSDLSDTSGQSSSVVVDSSTIDSIYTLQ